MGQYRAYCFDGKGKVWVEDHIAAQSDQEAIDAALTIAAAVKLEIRDDNRLVKIVDRQFPTN